jgi:hypothetical protein
MYEDNGGYNVQEVPDPASIYIDSNSNIDDGISSIYDRLLRRGKHISAVLDSIGIHQLAIDPIIKGITKKKIIIRA